MKKLIFLFAMAVFGTYQLAGAQGNSSSGGSSVGFRFGNEQGISYKQHIGGGAAIEGILSARSWSTNITVLYHIFHKPTGWTPGMDWFVGAGGHAWLYNRNNRDFPGYTGGLGLGVDGVVGLQYNFADIPFNASLDWKPAFNLIGGNYFQGGGFGLSIRYRFK